MANVKLERQRDSRMQSKKMENGKQKKTKDMKCKTGNTNWKIVKTKHRSKLNDREKERCKIERWEDGQLEDGKNGWIIKLKDRNMKSAKMERR